MEAAAIIAASLMGVVAIFQVALALGAPARHVAWGGAYGGRLPTHLRVASALAGFIVYPILIVYVLATAQIVDIGWLSGSGTVGMWVLTGVFGLGTLANVASRSPRERYWALVSGTIAVCCAIVATQV